MGRLTIKAERLEPGMFVLSGQEWVEVLWYDIENTRVTIRDQEGRQFRKILDPRLVVHAWVDDEQANYRLYYFDTGMNIVLTEDLAAQKPPHDYAIRRVRKSGYYTYAIGPL